MDLRHLNSHVLMAQISDLLSAERSTIVAFLLHLAEIERRQIHLELGHSSLFAFCTERLKLPKSSAYRRTTASRLVTRFTVIGDYLADGRLSLTTLCLLKDVLTDLSVKEVLERAAGKTEDEVALLVAALAPKPVPRNAFQRVPAPVVEGNLELFGNAATAGTSRTEVEATGAAPVGLPPMPKPPAPSLVPITGELRRLNMTVGPRFVAALQRAKSLLSHKIPSGNLEAVLLTCLELANEQLEKRRSGSDKPRPRKGEKELKKGYVSVSVRREVIKRDDESCDFIGADGKRCGSTYQLQFHHTIPAANDGPSTVEFISMRCEPHNQFEANRDFGCTFMDEKRKQGGGGKMD